MRTLAELRKNIRISRFSAETIEIRGEESLICDPRGRVKPAEQIERKLQDALRVDHSRFNQLKSVYSN
jgi:hypothetical protein